MAIDDWRQRLTDRAKSHAFQPDCRRFYFLRHGQTDHNRKRICQGHADIPLNEAGLTQANAAAALLIPVEPRSIRASDLMRVRQTAAPVATHFGMEIKTDPRLRERAFGVYENTPIEGHLWSFDHPTVETIEDFVDRSLEGFKQALVEDDVLVVTHGGLRRVLAAALGTEMADWTAHNALPTRFTRMDDANWRADVLTKTGIWPADGAEPTDLDR